MRLAPGLCALLCLLPVRWATAQVQATPTFARDIAPIIYANCSSCHRPGEAGPFSLLTYEDVRKRAQQIADLTRRRLMPPWLPQAGYGDFEDTRRLTDAQIRLIGDWAAAGAPQGSAAQTPPPPHFTDGWQLGPPDLIVEAQEPLAVPASGPDLFWNFILTPDVKSTRFVRAIEIRPGNKRLLHHANMQIDRARSARRQEIAPGKGFPGMDLVIERSTFEPDDGRFLFWKPGAPPYVEPDGLAWRLDPGNDLVLNAHLLPSGKLEQVQPVVGLYFTSKPQDKFPMLVQLEHDGALKIPAGSPDFVISDDFRLPLDSDVLAVYPHAHYLGKLMEGYATLPDGSRKWLVRIPEWNLSWQSVYYYRQPVFLPKGSVISMRFHYDNSAANPRNPNHPPRRVQAGNTSRDEMGHLWLEVLPRSSGDRRLVLQEALLRHRLEKYPNEFLANLHLGTLLLARLDASGAMAPLQVAVRIEPDNPEPHNFLGAALERLGRAAEAMTQFQRALELRPDYINARFNLANALAKSGKLDEAIENLRQVAAAYPDDRLAKDRLARTLATRAGRLAARGELDEASAQYDEVVKIEPGDAGLRNEFGELLMRRGKFAEALEQFDKALSLNPSLEEARKNREQAQQQAGR